MSRKKKVLEVGDIMTSHLREESNLEPIHIGVNIEFDEVNQVVNELDKRNELGQSDEVTSDESENNSNWEGPRQRKTPFSRLKEEVCEIRLAMSNLAYQRWGDRRYLGLAIYVRTNDRVILRHGGKKL